MDFSRRLRVCFLAHQIRFVLGLEGTTGHKGQRAQHGFRDTKSCDLEILGRTDREDAKFQHQKIGKMACYALRISGL